MTIMTNKTENGEPLRSGRIVGTGSGSTAEEAIQEFKSRTDWNEEESGKLYVPVFESHPSI